ncbi:hypothetical protein CAPTEDRAFT_200104 [Capitella teleta]|uniref:Uncharacterized protein n=1 Tax=Capitella teleta TaxID=283909 RepID=R7USD9_CAPTE|nr:hypothetical protein CAPTEDRAFT_200104 [Capitella teleta]|eukprot:ELU09100.1 hypothetical protein CAPTEDRAFT_200104 [Capitella teleta]
MVFFQSIWQSPIIHHAAVGYTVFKPKLAQILINKTYSTRNRLDFTGMHLLEYWRLNIRPQERPALWLLCKNNREIRSKIHVAESRKFITDKWDDLSNAAIVELQEDDMEAILKQHECQEENFLRLQSWVKSVDGGEERFSRMLENVKLSKCCRSFLQDTVMDEEFLQNKKGIQVIQQALKDISISA